MMKYPSILSLFILFLLSSCNTGNEKKTSDLLILDMVHSNPAEGLTKTSFNNPEKLVEYGYNGIVLNDFKFAHSTLNFATFDSTLFPNGTKERKWMDEAATELNRRINDAHSDGLSVYCFIDVAVLPTKLVEKYKDDICNADGKIDFLKPLTCEIHRIMLRELFAQFPNLDGLVIRTGESYLHNVPYHSGNNPILYGPESHVKILSILREEAIEKLDKKIIYRTWDFGFFHTDPEYYLTVTNQIEPHKNLIFSIKHTEGDYHRTFPFNPTLGIGKHKQIVEVQCQREYEGKGAHPNYVMDGVINGFEEYPETESANSLDDLQHHPLFAGVWSWSRGGGWVGPYIKNELWCDLNAFVISAWASNPGISEEDAFHMYTEKLGLSEQDSKKFRKLCLLSAQGVVRGHNSLVHNVNVWWTRDQFFGGIDLLGESFNEILDKGLIDEILQEKSECVRIWEEILDLSGQIETNYPDVNEYLEVSALYGLIKYSIIAEAWNIMLKGMLGDRNGAYDIEGIASSIGKYDGLWEDFRQLESEHSSCASIYEPYSFVFKAPHYHGSDGIQETVDHYRKLVF